MATVTGTSKITNEVKNTAVYKDFIERAIFYSSRINNYLAREYNGETINSHINMLKAAYKANKTIVDKDEKITSMTTRFKEIDQGKFAIVLESYIKEGALLFEDVRKFLTNETISINFGFEDEGKIKSIHFNSLEEFFNVEHIVKLNLDYSTSTLYPVLKTAVQLTGIRNEIIRGNKKATDIVSSKTFERLSNRLLDSYEKRRKAKKKINSGYLYEALLTLKQKNLNLNTLKEVTLFNAYEQTNKNHASIQYGGDIDDEQVKYGTGAQAANLSTIQNALINVNKILTNFIAKPNFASLENSIKNKLTKINFEGELTKNAKKAAEEKLIAYLREALGIDLK